MTPEWRSERTVTLFLFGLIAVSPPFLAIFAADTFLFGVPLLYAYLFAVWIILIGLLALISGRSESGAEPDSAAETPREP